MPLQEEGPTGRADTLLGYDEYHPVTHSGKHMTPKGLGWIIVDALDTMMLMNMTTELTHARQWVHSNLTYDQDHDVNTFETTIRMLGGLLSAHYLSAGYPGKFAPVQDDISDDIYVEKAADLADRLLSAYETQSGVPLASVNLHTYKGIPSHADAGASSTAEATSLQLEMKYLAKLTGEAHYWEKAENVMKAVDDNQPADGLVPIFIYADRGTFRGDNIRFGSRGDSYYEYLIKQYLQTSQEEPVYQAMWNESMAGMKKHLITYSSPNNFTVLAERPNGLNRDLEAKMDHLVCFLPGTIALATTGGLPLSQVDKRPNWGEQQDEDMELARELTKTCMGMYHTETGLAPEIAHFNIHDPPLMYNDFGPREKPKSPASFANCKTSTCTAKEEEAGKDDYIFKPADKHNLQRPETVESLFYMWRITGDEIYRHWGWEMFQAFVKWTAVDDGEGFSSVSDVTKIPPPMRDNMESFWMVSNISYSTKPYRNTDLSARPKPSNTSTSSSPPPTYSPSATSSSTPKPTRSHASQWASSSRRVGNGKRTARRASRRLRLLLLEMAMMGISRSRRSRSRIRCSRRSWLRLRLRRMVLRVAGRRCSRVRSLLESDGVVSVCICSHLNMSKFERSVLQVLLLRTSKPYHILFACILNHESPWGAMHAFAQDRVSTPTLFVLITYIYKTLHDRSILKSTLSASSIVSPSRRKPLLNKIVPLHLRLNSRLPRMPPKDASNLILDPRSLLGHPVHIPRRLEHH